MSAPAAPAEEIISSAARQLAEEVAPRPGPKSVRMDRDLIAWYEGHASDLSALLGVKIAPNRAYVIALQAYRAAVQSVGLEAFLAMVRQAEAEVAGE